MNSSYSKNVEFEKPRRLEEETALYLSQLESQLDEIDKDDESVEILVSNVLEEIKQRTASAASDRRTNYIIEKICYAANIAQLMEIMRRCTPYSLFLVQNRYSSHIIQAMIARLCFLFKSQATAGVEDDDLESTTLAFVADILGAFRYVATDMCGSHVLRSIICLLAGIPVISERKGKTSKHQHSVSLAEPLDKLLHADGYHIDSRMSFGVPAAFQETLLNAAGSLLTPSDTAADSSVSASRELQELVANTGSCAVLGIMLRIFFSPHIIQGGAEVALQIVRSAFEFDADSSSDDEDLCAVVYYAMGGDRSGSYFIETVTECCGLEFLIELTRRGLFKESHSSSATAEFVRDGVGNFVVQSLMKRLCSEFTWPTTRSAFRTANSSTAAELASAVEVTTRLLSTSELRSPELFPYIVQARGGVGLWMIKLGAAMTAYTATLTTSKKSFALGEDDVNVGDEIASKFLSEWAGGGVAISDENFAAKLDVALVTKLTGAGGKLKEEKAPQGKDKGVREGYKASKAAARNGGNGVMEQNSVANLACRVIGAVLGLNNTESCRALSAAVTRLPHEILTDIACTGPLSRCVMDSFFACKSNGRDRSLFLSGFILPNLCTLANHPVGHHAIRLCFESASSVDKERIVSAVCDRQTRSQIANSREGKVIIRLTNADLYSRSSSEWKALIAKQKKAEAMLLELETGEVAPVQAKSFEAPFPPPATSRAAQDRNEAEYAESGASSGVEAAASSSGGRKRKRKHASSKSGQSEGVEEDGAEATGTFERGPGGGDSAHKLDKKHHKKHKDGSTSDSFSKKGTGRSSSGDRSGDGSRADMKKIKALKSGKLLSIKKITEELQK